MIVGQENVGKSSLLRSLKNANSKVKATSFANLLSTDGIDVQSFSTKKKDKDKRVKIDWSAWDFAGLYYFYSM
jgi:GTPase SAR1 family protein